MRHESIGLHETHAFSSTFLDYINSNEKLKPFYNVSPTVANFKEQIKQKNFSGKNREVLVRELKKQYQDISMSKGTELNVEALLDGNTFTITTGHQLNIFTGPLYFIYKIITVINACKTLKSEYPAYNFVPVYWMASEDHDFEEISYFRLEGKKYTWETNQKGAVGQFDPSGLSQILAMLPGDNDLFRKAYLEHKTLAGAVRYYVNELFKNEGLVVIDADSPRLKQVFAPVIKSDLLEQKHHAIVSKTDLELENLGYSTQVNAREINFFYLDNSIRERIVKEEGKYKVLNTKLQFSEQELEQIIDSNPEKFSPNVILRPLYQEWILPNLAYIGGPAELVYWLQLKGIFDEYKMAFPILMPRNFALVVDRNSARKMNKLGFKTEKWFLPIQALVNECVEQDTAHDISYSKRVDELKQAYQLARDQAAKVDSTLVQHLEALEVKAVKLMYRAEKKLVRAEKRHHDDKIRQVESVKARLFPNDSLQERTDNFLNFYQTNPNFIKELLENFDAFNYRFNVLFEA